MSKRLRKSNLSIIESQKEYDTEDKCREYFLKLRFPNGIVCPYFGCTGLGYVRTRHLLCCKSFRKEISVTSGTVFSPYKNIFDIDNLGKVSVRERQARLLSNTDNEKSESQL